MIKDRGGSPGNSPVGLIIVGAGGSHRMGGIDKVFAPLGGHPLAYWPLLAAQNSALVSQVILVVSAKNIPAGVELARTEGFSKVSAVCEGGGRRQDSVANGLARLSACERVIIHDAARPFLTQQLISQGIEAARPTGAAIAAIPVKDTVKVAASDLSVIETPRREMLWLAQTPQVFAFDIITAAYRIEDEVSDDSSLVERLGVTVKLYYGSYENIKVTTPEDLMLAETILKEHQQCASA